MRVQTNINAELVKYDSLNISLYFYLLIYLPARIYLKTIYYFIS